MVRVQSRALAKLLSSTGNSVIKFPTYHDIPDTLWTRIEQHTSGNAREVTGLSAPTNMNAASFKLLIELFKTALGPSQRLAIGNIIQGYKRTLPLDLEIKYIKSFMNLGMKYEALERWRQKAINPIGEHPMWIKIGVLCQCQLNRVVPAERLVAENPITLDQEICSAFIYSYSTLHNYRGVEIWLSKLFENNVSERCANRALRAIISEKLWPQAKLMISRMTHQKLQVTTKLLAKCVLSFADDVSTKELALLLHENGDLVNEPSFKNMLIDDPRKRLSKILRTEGGFEQANKIVQNYSGIFDISLCYQLLQYYKNATQIDASLPVDKEWLNGILAKVNRSTLKDSMYVQFMFSYYQFTNDHCGFQKFISDHKLYKLDPLIQGKLSYSNYLLMWRLLHKFLAYKPDSSGNISYYELPVSLRQLAATTINSTAVTENLLGYLLQTLQCIPDVPAMITLITFCAENFGIYPKDKHILAALTGSPAESIPTGGLPLDNLINSISEFYNQDTNSVLDQSQNFIKSLEHPREIL